VITPQVKVQPQKVLLAGKAPKKAQSKNKDLKNSYIQITPRTEIGANPVFVNDFQDPEDGGQSHDGGGNLDGGGDVPTLTNRTELVQAFYAEYSLSAGDYEFPADTTANPPLKEAYKLENCITPVATGWRLMVPAAGLSPGLTPIDAAHHVLRFSDNWSAQDFTKIDHSGTISFLITPKQANIPAGKQDLSEYLSNLHDKTFYVRIYLWWENGFMSCTPSCPTCSADCRGSITCPDSAVVITGLCHGGSICTESGKKVMECQILDYWKIMQDMFFLNSPFFDGMRDFNAVFRVLKFAGLRDGAEKAVENFNGTLKDKWPPAMLLKTLSDSPNPDIFLAWPSSSCLRSRRLNTWEFVLPSSYDVLQSPIFKFGDGSKFEEALTKFAQMSGKVTYFDRWGVFHYENRPEEQIAFTGEDPLNYAIMHFYASPRDIAEDSCKDKHRQVIKAYTYKRMVGDVYNVIHILSTTPEGSPVYGDAVNWSSIYDPTSPGYIGYKRMWVQTDGIFGNQEGVNNAVQYYKSSFTAPFGVQFNSLGTGKLKPLDIITFSGLQIDGSELVKQPFRLLTVSNTVEPKENMWETAYEAEWLELTANPPTSPA
jgi:hypothetical protein